MKPEEIKSMLSDLAESTGAELEDITKEFKKAYDKEIDKGKDPALFVTGLLIGLESKFKTGTDPYVGMILGYGTVGDLAINHFGAIEDLLRTNEQLAYTSGKVVKGEDGNPIFIDTREFFKDGKMKNWMFNKPLQHSYQRTLIGLFAPIVEGERGAWRLTTIAMSTHKGLKLYEIEPKIGVPVRAYLASDNRVDGVYDNRYDTLGRFNFQLKPEEIEDFSKFDRPDVAAIKGIIKQDDWFASIEDIEDFIEEYGKLPDGNKDHRLIVVTEGYVSSANHQEGTTLWNLTLKAGPQKDAPTVGLNLQEWQWDAIDFGAGSKITVAGFPFMRQMKEDGKYIDEYVPTMRVYNYWIEEPFRQDPAEYPLKVNDGEETQVKLEEAAVSL